MEITLEQAYNFFIFDRETYCKKKTISNYDHTLSYFFDYLEGVRNCKKDAILVNTITVNDLKGYVAMLRNRKKLSTHPFKPTVDTSITKRSIRTYSIDLRTFFNFLYENDYMNENITKKFKLIKAENKLILPVYSGEVKKIDELFNLKTASGLRNYCMIHLMLDEGFRSGDVCNLTCKSINFQEGYILVLDGKGDKDRIVPLAKRLRDPLYRYLTLYRGQSMTHDFLFTSVRDPEVYLTDNAIKCLFSRIRKKTEIARLKPHLLRHTFATSFIMGGGDLESLRIYLGHTSYATTQNYLHLANTYSRMSADVYRLDSVFFQKYYNSYNGK